MFLMATRILRTGLIQTLAIFAFCSYPRISRVPQVQSIDVNRSESIFTGIPIIVFKQARLKCCTATVHNKKTPASAFSSASLPYWNRWSHDPIISGEAQVTF
jgi:hypothetical protein